MVDNASLHYRDYYSLSWPLSTNHQNDPIAGAVRRTAVAAWMVGWSGSEGQHESREQSFWTRYETWRSLIRRMVWQNHPNLWVCGPIWLKQWDWSPDQKNKDPTGFEIISDRLNKKWNQQGFGYLSGSAICGIQEGEKWLISGNSRQLSALSAMEVSLNFAFRAGNMIFLAGHPYKSSFATVAGRGPHPNSYLSIINPLARLFIASLIPLLISPTTSWAVFCHCSHG